MRKVKKIAFLVTLILSLALLMMPFVALSVSAAESTDILVTATTSTSVKQGESGICYVYIDSLEKLSSLIVTVHYDSSKISVTVGNVFNVAPSLLYDIAVKDGSVQFSYIFDGNGNATKTQLFYFEYTVLTNAKGGETYFDVVVSEAYDSSLSAMPVVGSRCVFSIPTVEVHSYTRRVIDNFYKKSDATCTEPSIYYYCCETCDAKSTATFEYGAPLGHIGGTATCTAQAQCTRCYRFYGNILEHRYANSCDENCDVCGYIRTVNHSYSTEWSRNEDNHWYECSVCGDRKSEAVHTPGADATESSDQVCTVCGYVIKAVLVHAHNYVITKNDEINHWNECVCGDKIVIAEHTWNDGIIIKEATYDEEGEIAYICSVCSYTKLEKTEKLIREDDTATDSSVTTEIGVDTDADTDIIDEPTANRSNRQIVLIAVGVSAIVFVVLIFFVIIKIKIKNNY